MEFYLATIGIAQTVVLCGIYLKLGGICAKVEAHEKIIDQLKIKLNLN